MRPPKRKQAKEKCIKVYCPFESNIGLEGTIASTISPVLMRDFAFIRLPDFVVYSFGIFPIPEIEKDMIVQTRAEISNVLEKYRWEKNLAIEGLL